MDKVDSMEKMDSMDKVDRMDKVDCKEKSITFFPFIFPETHHSENENSLRITIYNKKSRIIDSLKKVAIY